ncbi:uncharacterized protein LOC121853961 [Homarus americanus]|uniref:uncharacterized protein LOC121853961 n=1 Tax=Homarus americanus TaxID=6706 RepID=UPI001C48CDF1|nr:uncharacterized protein LOC121853961 [Homarus americanus]
MGPTFKALTKLSLMIVDSLPVSTNVIQMVTVPSDLLVQLLDVSRSLQKLLPADLPIPLLDVSPEDVLARVNDEGPNSLLTLALRHHALLQQRNEDLLTQQARCTAQIEAPQEDKQELRLHLQDCKKKLQYLQRGPTDILPPTDSAKPTDTIEDVKKGVKIDLCPCRENLTEAQLEERNFVGLDCVCEKVTILPKTTPAPVLLGTGSRVKDCAGHQTEGATGSGMYEIYPSEYYRQCTVCEGEEKLLLMKDNVKAGMQNKGLRSPSPARKESLAT